MKYDLYVKYEERLIFGRRGIDEKELIDLIEFFKTLREEEKMLNRFEIEID